MLQYEHKHTNKNYKYRNDDWNIYNNLLLMTFYTFSLFILMKELKEHEGGNTDKMIILNSAFNKMSYIINWSHIINFVNHESINNNV